MHPSELRRYIQALTVQEPYETLWNSETVLNEINSLLDPLKFSGPHYAERQNQPCMDWFRVIKNNPPLKVWFSLCKQDFNIDIWVSVTVGQNDMALFEYHDDPPATISAVMFSVKQAVEIAKQKLMQAQQLVSKS